VATVTEIYDFLRVLFARAGTIHCLKCGRPVHRDTIDAMADELFQLPSGTPVTISFFPPPERGIEELRREGFFRIMRGNEVVNLDEIDIPTNESLEVFVDRLPLEREERDRLVDSLETGLKRGNGRVRARSATGDEFLFTDRLECRTCGIEYQDPVPNQFSFNSPQGACPACHGFGDQAVFDEDKIIPDSSLSLEEGAIEPWTKPVSRRRMKGLLEKASSRGIPTDAPFRDLTPEQQDFVWHGEGAYKGVLGFFDRLQRKKYKVQVRVFLARYRKYIPCPECGQTRLNPAALSVRLGGRNIGEVVRLTVREAEEWFAGLELDEFQRGVADKLLIEIRSRLQFLLEVGLDYITLDRMTFTLSGGEAQRINLAAALSSSLVGTLFVLDEPSIGLHPRDNRRLIEILRALKEVGNTVLVVEHDPEIIRSAEHIIDLGPWAGEHGGRVVYDGPMEEFLEQSQGLTARFMRGERMVERPERRRRPERFITIRGAHLHNLQNIDARIPLDVFTCVTGVSGSGKSTLLFDLLYKGWQGKANGGFTAIEGREALEAVIMVDQSPVSASPRSIPATYTKAMDDIRTLFSRTREARAQGFRPGFFSFNTPGGRCEACKGAGSQIVEMQFLSDVVLTCEACGGKRFQPEILDIRYRERNMDDVLHMSIDESLEFFADQPRILRKLKPLVEVGLGYLRLGQPTTTLSGGELQRIKLAHHLVHRKKGHILYLFDEPTIGLHLHDVDILLQSFQKLVEQGHSVVVIEHNLDMIKCADWVLDLGPEGGEGGGRIVAEGPPEAIARAEASHTGRFLRPLL